MREDHRLVIVGDGPARAELEELVRTLGLASSVEFAGDSYDVAHYLYGSKLLVSGLANNPVTEAIATGTPVITVELGEIAALYGRYRHVYVMEYPPGGRGRIESAFLQPLIEQTADTICRVLNSYPTLHPMSTNGHPRLYSWDERFQDEIDLYEGMFAHA